MTTKLFTIRECGKGPIVCGLERITSDNGNLLRLATDKPLDALDVGESTTGRAGRDVFEVVREADAGMTPERARYLLASTVYGSLRVAFDPFGGVTHPDGITEDEDEFIRSVWSRMPGWTSYHSAVCAIAYPEKWPCECPRT